MTNPYLLDLPAVVSFSGGRTSGFMLRHILDAHGGQPDDLQVCFQNTALEHPVTYTFVRECERRWGVDITWLEYFVNDENNHDCKIVDFDTASRDGEPFTQLILKKKYLPNPVTRICTANLKMRTLDRHLKGMPGFEEGYTNAVGLRYDEPRRVHRIRSYNSREDMYCPMYHAKHTEEDVLAWWKEQDFDLELPLTGNLAGNCVGCYLKGRGKLEVLMEEMPEHFDWWVRAEQLIAATANAGASFRSDRPTYKSMMATARSQGRLFPADDEDTIPCMCTD
tara:strand:- start:1015 stop:1854 length:840 start_codon:yes stop_codon:yes gene_type:complete